jgi:hypothetical protein
MVAYNEKLPEFTHVKSHLPTTSCNFHPTPTMTGAKIPDHLIIGKTNRKRHVDEIAGCNTFTTIPLK